MMDDNPNGLGFDYAEDHEVTPVSPPEKEALFTLLFRETIVSDYPEDRSLNDLAQHVIQPLSDHFAGVTAKGGAFFRMKEAEGAPNTDRYSRDQSMRAHIVNGMLPALDMARSLTAWGADHKMRHYDDMVERLFMAGYVLHDYTKLKAVKVSLTKAGFSEMQAPSPEMIPTLEKIFTEWAQRLGLDAFLAPVGGLRAHLHNLIYVACNTQRLHGTLLARSVLPQLSQRQDAITLAAQLSNLADLLAYVAPNPRALVRHPTVRQLVQKLAWDAEGQAVASLTYHHVAENRGVLLNMIHNAALDAMRVPDQRVPILYATSGVVYLERASAPPAPDVNTIAEQVVEHVRQTCQEVIETRKGIKRGNVGIKADDSYDDLFDLADVVRHSVTLVAALVGRSLIASKYDKIVTNQWPGSDAMPAPPIADDLRADYLAEWLTFMERTFRSRLRGFDFVTWALALDQFDLPDDHETRFRALYEHPVARKGGGVFYHWFWLSGHILDRYATSDPEEWRTMMQTLADQLVSELPEDLPDSAYANQAIWDDLKSYTLSVLTIHQQPASASVDFAKELKQYSETKTRRGGKVCANCGSAFATREQLDTAVSFQPGVYTARLPLYSSNNKRQSCSICALEELLRNLLSGNTWTGSDAEKKLPRYAFIYPGYFFTPHTLQMVRRFYQHIANAFYISWPLKQEVQDSDLAATATWQTLTDFLMPEQQDDHTPKILRYTENAQAFFMFAWRQTHQNPVNVESWIVPTFLAFVLPLCLDVKVVLSTSGVPLLNEADDLRETVWLDGLHPSLAALLPSDRLHIDDLRPTLARLMVAYIVLMDTEGFRWDRIPPLARDLAQSPLYLFHYLSKQTRKGERISPLRVRQYLHYAQTYFNHDQDEKEYVKVSHARELVHHARGFYRAATPLKGHGILRPLTVVAHAIEQADLQLFDSDDALVELCYGELRASIERVGTSDSLGYYPKGISEPARNEHMRAFCHYFVHEIFVGVFDRDVAAMTGKQFNLLRNAYEFIYRDEQQAEWDAKRATQDESEA